MHLTKVDLEIDVIVGDDPWELLDDPSHLDGCFEPHVIPSPWTSSYMNQNVNGPLRHGPIRH